MILAVEQKKETRCQTASDKKMSSEWQLLFQFRKKTVRYL